MRSIINCAHTVGSRSAAMLGLTTRVRALLTTMTTATVRTHTMRQHGRVACTTHYTLLLVQRYPARCWTSQLHSTIIHSDMVQSVLAVFEQHIDYATNPS